MLERQFVHGRCSKYMDVTAFDIGRFASGIFIGGNDVEGHFHGSMGFIQMKCALQLSVMLFVQAGFLLGRSFGLGQFKQVHDTHVACSAQFPFVGYEHCRRRDCQLYSICCQRRDRHCIVIAATTLSAARSVATAAIVERAGRTA